MPAEKLAALETEHKMLEETNKVLLADVKGVTAELSKIKSSPTDSELAAQLEDTAKAVSKAIARLEPLRSGTTLVSTEDLALLDAEWTKWRAEWVRRRKIFNTYVSARVKCRSPCARFTC